MKGLQAFRAFIVLLSCLSPFAVQGAIVNMSASLTGSEEVPPNGSAGTGTASIIFDDVSNQLDWNITFSGLTGAAIAAHFHGPAAPGATAPPALDIAAISGLTSPMIGSFTISDTDEADLLAGLWYINIHTEMYPDGEIRGQVQAEQQVIPVPAAAWLLFSGLAGLVAASRARRS